jgi:hypothetical protein
MCIVFWHIARKANCTQWLPHVARLAGGHAAGLFPCHYDNRPPAELSVAARHILYLWVRLGARWFCFPVWTGIHVGVPAGAQPAWAGSDARSSTAPCTRHLPCSYRPNDHPTFSVANLLPPRIHHLHSISVNRTPVTRSTAAISAFETIWRRTTAMEPIQYGWRDRDALNKLFWSL